MQAIIHLPCACTVDDANNLPHLCGKQTFHAVISDSREEATGEALLCGLIEALH